MTQGYTYQALERYLGTYCTIKRSNILGRQGEVTGLLFPLLDGIKLNEDGFGVLNLNGDKASAYIKEIESIKIETVSEKTQSCLEKCYQAILEKNTAHIKYREEARKMDDKLMRLRKKEKVIESRIQRQMASVSTSMGMISYEQMESTLEKMLVAAGAMKKPSAHYPHEELYHLRHYEVTFKRSYHSGLEVQFYHNQELGCDAVCAGYDFIFEEYPRHYKIGRHGSSDYPRLMLECSDGHKSLKAEGLSSDSIECSQHSDLSFSDKYSLYYFDKGLFWIKGDVFTKELLTLTKKTFKQFLNA